MATQAIRHGVKRVDTPREIHYSIGGLITEEDLRALQADLYKAALPFIEAKQPFRVLGDMREFLPQKQEIVELLRDSQQQSAKLGMEKMAILFEQTLTKVQFRRISDMVEIEFFTDRGEALDWLRKTS